ncbi:hypothetical protein BN85407490 [Alteracholeplasma palmae J233]|uniref:Uncharacterized protein n=1 Tax=Alteracholeplasma palmae (strain ATCC 49389 / J233) TaxID=1318466 RepID=U4KRN6_ALTPJ|nr:hypothetical protein [Alteracholeplasma palmae]CCV64326.1 hypothetical protein BN85407490 [Alteracholeplasma palmae J233]
MRKKANTQTKQQLSHKFKPSYRGLVSILDSKLIEEDILDSSKLVYAGLYASIPRTQRLENISKEVNHKYYGRKKKLIDQLGIAESTYYTAINELEEKGYIKTVVNPDKTGYVFYYLLKEIDMANAVSFVTSEMLQRKYIKTKRRLKTLSPKAKITLGRLHNLATSDYNRNIEVDTESLIKELKLARSTTFYMITKLLSCGAMKRKEKQHGLYKLLLLDEYTQYQIIVNQSGDASYKQSNYKNMNNYPDDALDLIGDAFGLKKYN